MNTIFLVNIILHHPAEKNRAMNSNFVFDNQPTEDDVFNAFCEEPRIRRIDDFDKYAPVLKQALAAYGVPKMHMLRMEQTDGFVIGVPRIRVDWYANIVGPNYAVPDAPLGSISVSIQPVHPVTVAVTTQSEVKTKRARNPALRTTKEKK